MSYTVRLVSSEQEFAALEQRWNELASRAVDGSTFLTHTWLYAWWTAYRPEAALRIVLAEAGGELCGIAPIILSREGLFERLLTRLRFVGDGSSETDHMNFVVAGQDRAEIMRVLLGAVGDLPWHVAHFNQMWSHSANTAQLLEHARGQGWLTDVVSVPCPVCRLPSTPDGVLKLLPSRLRTAVRSARKRLEAEHAVEFGLVTNERELAPALDSLYRNHASRWQIKGQSGVFVDERKRHFYDVLSRRLLAQGALRFFFLRAGDEIVAQQFCFEFNGRVELLQEGFAADWADRNVGNILRLRVFEHLCASGVREYDFLAGSSRHKRQWSNAETQDLLIRSFRPGIIGWSARMLSNLRSRARSASDEPAGTEP